MEYSAVFKDVLHQEADAIVRSIDFISDKQIDELINIYKNLLLTGGQLIFVGVGKSGIIAMKLASTFSSLGLSSFYLHPTDALHGDLGRVGKSDAIVFLSKSGTTEELLKLIPFLPADNRLFVGLLGNINSEIGKLCQLVFDCSVKKEACLNNQAPTTSSTVAIAIGDAMAVVFEKYIGLSKEGFAINHPGGILGKSLRLTVKDLMISKENTPMVSKDAQLKDVILKMTEKNVGACAVINTKEELLGIIVEGDFRRTFSKEDMGLESPVKDIMNSNPIIVGQDVKAYTALELMEKRKNQIYVLPVVSDHVFKGFIRLHDLLKEGFSLNS